MSQIKLSIVVPCYNEESTLEACIENVMAAFESEADTELELIVVDDCSTDRSVEIATGLSARFPQIVLEKHPMNRGKGAALRTGFSRATGDFIAIQDADLEYDPNDIKRLLVPLKQGRADVVYGSRFLTGEVHRVLYYWHSMGNKFLTFLSNMFTDLNLSDVETCYKVFRREVIQSIDLQEDRFGFEPEVTAKIAERRLRVYEMGIAYFGRTYEEGKKIGTKDGFRALYCIVKYSANRAPAALQFLLYTFVGGVAALFNLLVFAVLSNAGASVEMAAGSAFVLAAGLNYLLCITFLFKHKARWNTIGELIAYLAVVATVGAFDVLMTRFLIQAGTHPLLAKATASLAGLALNFIGRKTLVFPELARGPWGPQVQRGSGKEC